LLSVGAVYGVICACRDSWSVVREGGGSDEPRVIMGIYSGGVKDHSVMKLCRGYE